MSNAGSVSLTPSYTSCHLTVVATFVATGVGGSALVPVLERPSLPSDHQMPQLLLRRGLCQRIHDRAVLHEMELAARGPAISSSFEALIPAFLPSFAHGGCEYISYSNIVYIDDYSQYI